MSLSFQTPSFALCASVAVVAICAIRRIKRYGGCKLPPGPKGIPFFGNLFQISMTPWKEFERWKEQYGPLVYITAAGRRVLILNTHQVAGDLLDRRGHIYSDRPRFILASEIFTRGLMPVFSMYDKMFRRARRTAYEALNKTRTAEFHPIHLKEAVTSVDGILGIPCGWEREFRRGATSTMLSVIYDLPTISSTDDPIVQLVNRFADLMVDYSSPGHYLVDIFTWMKYIPSWMAKWKREAEQGHEEYSKSFVRMFCDVETRINQGDERPSFAGTLIRERLRHRVSDIEAAWLAATLYSAGSETSATTMTWFMLAMIAYPEKQKKCQEELDRVVGRSRMPTFKDKNRLPYLCATVQEIFRWRAVTPIGVPHCTSEDDWYEGMFIPKGTICLANIWGINRDRNVYGDDADDFNPDRFLDENGQPSAPLADTKDEGHVSFGFGPRICLGRHMANNALFINIASVLWAANISALKDEVGKPIIPDTLGTVNAGLVIHPLPFDCEITPRFPEAVAIVAHTKELLE